jgi:hypothetical protein
VRNTIRRDSNADRFPGSITNTCKTILIEAARLTPRYNPQLAAVHERELQRDNRNRATLAVARKLVAYLMAVDKGGKPFQVRASAGEESKT